MEMFPDVAVDALLRAAMAQLRKTTNVFREWGSYNVMGTQRGKKVQHKKEATKKKKNWNHTFFFLTS